MQQVNEKLLKELLNKHKKWLNHDEDGEKFFLTYCNLKGFDFRNQDLRKAVLLGCDLRKANFENANLEYTDLSMTDLDEVNFKGSNLNYTVLDWAINIPPISMPMVCPKKGEFIGFKKIIVPLTIPKTNKVHKLPVIAKLRIPKEAKRSSSTGKKCRCSKAEVLEIKSIDNSENYQLGYSAYFTTNVITYEVGKIIEIENFDENRWNECSTGIHFFMTREEAINY